MKESSATISHMTDTQYDAASIFVLSELEAVRRNPSMYIGSTDSDGLHHLAFEVIYNAIDEALMGYCTRIEATLHEDGSCSVSDNGRGIPVEMHPSEKIPTAELVLTRLHSGGKFKKGSYHRPSGLHGVGLSCVNALSEWLIVDIERNGYGYTQRFMRAVPDYSLKKIGVAKTTGTTVRFFPDHLIFRNSTRFSPDVLVKRLEELAFLNPGVEIVFKDVPSNRYEVFKYETGCVGYIEKLNLKKAVFHKNPIHIFHEEDKLSLEVAMQWTDAFEERILSYVNSVATIYGGTHVAGLKSAISSVINRYIREHQLLGAKSQEHISSLDITEGLTALISVKMDRPRFEGQTKTRLTVKSMQDPFVRFFTNFFERFLKNDSILAMKIVSKAVDSYRSRRAAFRAMEKARFKSTDMVINKEVYKKQFGIRSKSWHESAVWIANDTLLKQHAKMCDVASDDIGLDICCGSGVVGASFSNHVSKMIGLDITPQMTHLAKTRLNAVFQGNAYEMPFKNDTFGLAVTREVLHILPCPERPLSELMRVLKPGGQFITGQILPYGEEDSVWMYRIFKKKQPLIFNMFQEEDFRKMLLSAGFVDLKMTEYLLWESIDTWINTHETTALHRQEIRELYANAPYEAKKIHPFKITSTGEIMDQWRWCIFSCKKPL